MQKVRISNLKTFKIDLDDGSFVEIKDCMDYGMYKIFIEKFKDRPEKLEDKVDDMLNGIELLKIIIVKWNFVDENGEIVPYEPKHVDHLEVGTIGELLFKAMRHYGAEKKSSILSEQTSSTPQEDRA